MMLKSVWSFFSNGKRPPFTVRKGGRFYAVRLYSACDEVQSGLVVVGWVAICMNKQAFLIFKEKICQFYYYIALFSFNNPIVETSTELLNEKTTLVEFLLLHQFEFRPHVSELFVNV